MFASQPFILLWECGRFPTPRNLWNPEHLSCHYTHSKGGCHWAILMASEVTPQELSGAVYLHHTSCPSSKAPLALVLNTNSFKCVKSPSSTALAELHKTTIFMYYLYEWFNLFSDTFLSSSCSLDLVNLWMPFVNLQPLSRVQLHLRYSFTLLLLSTGNILTWSCAFASLMARSPALLPPLPELLPCFDFLSPRWESPVGSMSLPALQQSQTSSRTPCIFLAPTRHEPVIDPLPLCSQPNLWIFFFYLLFAVLSSLFTWCLVSISSLFLPLPFECEILLQHSWLEPPLAEEPISDDVSS